MHDLICVGTNALVERALPKIGTFDPRGVRPPSSISRIHHIREVKGNGGAKAGWTLGSRCRRRVFLGGRSVAGAANSGAEVLGPALSVRHATAIVAAEATIDAAILDINLHGDMIFPVADMLAERNIAFAFATGVDQSTLPARFSDIARVEKSFERLSVAAVLGPLMRVP